jgi:GWxTD domain-containing protein
MRRRIIALALTAILAGSSAAFAQSGLGDDLGEFYSYGDRYFIEFVTMPGPTPGKARTIVPFQLAHDLLTFRRAPSVTRRGEETYIATPELYVEAVASDGVIADRALWRDTLAVSSYSMTNAKDLYVPGTVELALRPGLYRFRYVLADEGPRSGMTEESQPIRVDDFASPSPAIGIPLFLRAINGDTLVAGAIGGAARFGERLRVYVPLAGDAGGGTLRYDLMTAPKGEKGERLPGRTVQSGVAEIVHGRTLAPAIVDNDIRFVMQRADPSVPRVAGAIIDARVDDMAPGDYLLLLSYGSGQGSVTDSVRFRLRWIDQPVSLYKVAYAIRALYPIATDATIEQLMRGSAQQQTTALERFWGERDPTPSTEYNEAMAEYYRRVDYAFFNFRTISQKDGAFTDRGKIYMLYGAPTAVDRQMQPNSYPREVWTYRIEKDGASVLKKEFIFVDESKTGAYRLVEYHDL